MSSKNRTPERWTRNLSALLAMFCGVVCCVPNGIASPGFASVPAIKVSMDTTNRGVVPADDYRLAPRSMVDAGGGRVPVGPRASDELKAPTKRREVEKENGSNDDWGFVWHLTKTTLVIGAFVAPAVIWNDKNWVRYYAMTTATASGAVFGLAATSLIDDRLNDPITIGLVGLVLGGIGGWLVSNWSTANEGVGRPLTVGFSFTPYLLYRIDTYE